MRLRKWIQRVALAIGVGVVCCGHSARGDEWGRYYHWPYSGYQQYYWSPNEYEQVYDYQYRYPAQVRHYPFIDGWRSWLYAPKPYYRGYHFILDRF